MWKIINSLMIMVSILFILTGCELAQGIKINNGDRMIIYVGDEKQLNILNYLIRCLIVNEVFINILSVVLLMFLSKNNYIFFNKIIYTLY